MKGKDKKNEVPFFIVKTKDSQSLEKENKAVERVPWKDQSQEERDTKREEYEGGAERNWRRMTAKLRKAEALGFISPEQALAIVRRLTKKENLISNFGTDFPKKVNAFNKYLFEDIFEEGTELDKDTYDILTTVRENAFWVCKYNGYLFGLNEAENELGIGTGKEKTESPLDYYLNQLDTSDKELGKKVGKK